jgi:hypothetical protein
MRDSPYRLGQPGVVGRDRATLVNIDWVGYRIRVAGKEGLF